MISALLDLYEDLYWTFTGPLDADKNISGSRYSQDL